MTPQLTTTARYRQTRVRRARRRQLGERPPPRTVGGAGWAVAAALALGASLPAVAAAPAGASGGSSTVWLCRPGMADDPCTAPLATTVVAADGRTSVQRATDAAHPPVDCFYVYPTVSEQSTINANLDVDPAETAMARIQASRFSQDCRVYAPVYPQLTDYAVDHPRLVTKAALDEAYGGVLAAWHDYLAHYNMGRGVVLIGHSQGAAMVIRLIRSQVDPDPSVRRRLVSAIILGGNVTVPVGKTVGGSFRHVPACGSATQTGCVVAYSSFDQTPPTDTLFGKPGAGVSELTGTTATAGLEVLCVDPAAPSGGSGTLEPYLPSATVAAPVDTPALGAPAVATPWAAYPDLYSARCEHHDGISWLQVTDVAKAGDTRPVATELYGPTWGLHPLDVNLALGNLVALVRTEALAYEH